MNLKISQLSATTNPQDSDVFPIINSGETKKVELRHITAASLREAKTAFLPLTGGTINGNVVLNGSIVTASGSSSLWNETFTLVNTNSATWDNSIDGIGSVNYIPKFITSSSVTNSIVSEQTNKVKILNPPLSATVNVEGSYLQTVNGNGDYVMRIQDGTGRINQYWNTMGGVPATYNKPNEGARKILFGGNTQQIFEVCSSSLTSPATGIPGDIITWEPAFTITSNGKVGIGTQLPSDSLTVIGNISANNISLSSVVLTSPNGTQYRLEVNNAGTLSTTLV